MSGKPIHHISKYYEEQLNQIILRLKSQHLSSKKKSPVDKRLNNDYNIVDGRKLDQEKKKLISKLFGHASVKEVPIKRDCLVAAAKETTKVNEKPKNCQELLKNFAFNFPQKNKITFSVNLGAFSNIQQAQPAIDPKDRNIEAQAEIDNKKQYKAANFQLDHMYFVLDTNVLVHDLDLLENVAKLTLPGTSGSFLYVPYIVIKELDILKCKQRTSFAARRAIEYLNDKFDDKEKIEAQSALQDAKQLIDIDSQDDSIINCCLQLQTKLPHIMLLTNDNNLRLKANASSIRVSTCYQLTSCNCNWWSPTRNRRKQQRRQRCRLGAVRF